MKKIVVLTLVLVVFMFAATIATVTINIPNINMLDPTLSVKHTVPLGDPFPGGPPLLRKGTGN